MKDRAFSTSDIEDARYAAADVVATAPPEQWAGWVRYFLEALEDVREDVTIRIERGSW